MLVARVLKTADADKQSSSFVQEQILVKEMDVCSRSFKGSPLLAENMVGAAIGDLVLCSTDAAKHVAAIGIIKTMELIGKQVYEKK